MKATPRTIFPKLTLILLAMLMTCAITACSTPAQVYVSPYDWDNLTYEDGRYYYQKEGTSQSRFGIDVSEYQGIINWELVAADGVEFAIIRLGNRGATEGQIYNDDYYEYNLKNAKAAGIPVGVYFFSQAITEEEALEEAEFVLESLNETSLKYPVVFDHEPVSGVEGRADNLSNDQLSLCAEVFCQAIERAGYDTMVYGNKADIAKLDNAVTANRPVWFAEYDASLPSGQFDFEIWQYTSNGTINGIPNRVDLNIHFLEP